MKTLKIETVTKINCKEGEIIGVEKIVSGEKGWIEKDEYYGSKYNMRCRDGAQLNNYWVRGYPSIESIVETYSDTEFKFYVFSSPKELFAWLAKD